MNSIGNRTYIDHIIERGSRKIDSASVVFFRIAFGAMMAVWAWDYLVLERVTKLYVEPRFHFTYYWFDWVHPLPGNGMYFLFLALMVLGVGIALGCMFRFAALLFAAGFTYFFLIDRVNYQNHYYLIGLISWWLPWLPLNRTVSFDAHRNPKIKSETVSEWVLWVLRFHIALPYFFGGIAKIHPDWFLGEPMRTMLAAKSTMPIVGSWLVWEPLVLVFVWGGLLFDIGIVPLLLWKRTRVLAYLLCVSFHLMNSVLFNIHIFPWFMIVATSLFFEPDWPRRILGGSGLSIPEDSVLSWGRASLRSRVFIVFLICYATFHCLWPMRHHLQEGDASWTEQGHHFAWRMMLRGKNVVLGYGITDKVTGDTVDGGINRFLSQEQSDKFGRNPDMILHFAHFLGGEYRKQTGHDAEVHALVFASLNGRKPELYIDPNVDLMKIARGTGIQSWVLPQNEPIPSKPWTLPIEQWRAHVNVPELKFLRKKPTTLNPPADVPLSSPFEEKSDGAYPK